MKTIDLFTIGFTKTTAKDFFTRLKKSGATKIIDVRLNNVSQLAGFAKQDDLRYFAKEICDVDYVHNVDLAPTKAMLDDYKKHKGSWDDYEKKFRKLISDRKIEQIPYASMDKACLLCSEDTADHCHRRIVSEYLKEKWQNQVDVNIINL